MLIPIESMRQPKANIYAHGEKKKQWQFLLTETASLKLDRLAQAEGLSRSEYLERLIRDQEDVSYAAS